ncbi:MAG: hypothetical protein AB7E81_24280 [Hyphomicrobiaceae bacterium]
MLGRLMAGWISKTTSRVEEEIEEKAKLAALWVLAGVLMAVAVAFATWLIYDELVAIYGVKATLGTIAGMFAGLSAAIMCWAIYLARHASTAADKAASVGSVAHEHASPNKIRPLGTADSETSAGSEDVQATVAKLIEMFGNTGMKKEALGLMAAKGVLGDVKPVQLVWIGLLAGFLVGRGK